MTDTLHNTIDHVAPPVANVEVSAVDAAASATSTVSPAISALPFANPVTTTSTPATGKLVVAMEDSTETSATLTNTSQHLHDSTVEGDDGDRSSGWIREVPPVQQQPAIHEEEEQETSSTTL